MAVTFDFGKCASCGENNSKTLQNCRACDAALPWAKTKKAPATTRNDAPSPSPNTALPKHKIGLGDLAYVAMAVQLSGGAIFLAGAILGIADMIQLVSLFPFADKMAMAIGAAIWAFGQNMD